MFGCIDFINPCRGWLYMDHNDIPPRAVAAHSGKVANRVTTNDGYWYIKIPFRHQEPKKLGHATRKRWMEVSCINLTYKFA